MFIEDDDYLYMMGLLKEVAERRSLKVFAFCLMPNHQHLLTSHRKKTYMTLCVTSSLDTSCDSTSSMSERGTW